MMKLLRFLGTGTGHESKGQGCQDRIRTESFPDGRSVMAVSDGCSSSKCAEIASQSNVDVICDLYRRFNIDSLSFDTFVQMYPELKKEEKKLRGDLAGCFAYILQKPLYADARKRYFESGDYIDARDYCATLLFAVREKKKTCIGHIGDGNIICFNKKGEIIYRSKEDNGEDSSHTFFTVSPDFREHFFFDVIPSEDIACIVMFSDGPQKMFKCEHGDIESGVREIIAKPVISGRICSDEALAKHLKKYIGHAKHYVFDDWSMVVAYNGIKTTREITPVSLDEYFMETFNKVKFDDFGNIIETEQDEDDNGTYTSDCNFWNEYCDTLADRENIYQKSENDTKGNNVKEKLFRKSSSFNKS